MTNDTFIEVENLTAHYGERKVLDEISFSIQRGEIFVIIGGSGCGKTTLLKHMTGLLTPTTGSICYDGKDITKMNEDEMNLLQRNIGIAFQSGALFNSMTVGDNVALLLKEYGNVDAALIPAIVRLKA